MDLLTFLIALIALLGVIVLFIFYFTERNRFLVADRFTVVQGATTGTTATLTEGDNVVFIANSTNPTTGTGAPLTLTIAASDSNEAGKSFFVVNPAPPATTPPTLGNSITVVAGPGVTLTDATGQNNIVAPGTTAEYVWTADNVAIRLR